MDPKAQARMSRSTRSAVLGAMFLMATSAIGPGFITQTTAFTVQLGAAFAFAIVASILVDIAVQLNVWRVIGVAAFQRPFAHGEIIHRQVGQGDGIAAIAVVDEPVHALLPHAPPLHFRPRHRLLQMRGIRYARPSTPIADAGVSLELPVEHPQI